jgi:hypothetical protein
MHLDPVTGMQERSVWPGMTWLTCYDLKWEGTYPWLSHGYLKPNSQFSGLPGLANVQTLNCGKIHHDI